MLYGCTAGGYKTREELRRNDLNKNHMEQNKERKRKTEWKRNKELIDTS